MAMKGLITEVFYGLFKEVSVGLGIATEMFCWLFFRPHLCLFYSLVALKSSIK